MTYEQMMAADGYAETHCKSAMQVLAARLLDWLPVEVSAVGLDSDEEANDWNRRLMLTCNGSNIAVVVDLQSDIIDHSGEYRWRISATNNGNPIALPFVENDWTAGQGESHIDDLIDQLTAIEIQMPEFARAIYNALHPA
jgi:hypothetical protein